MVYCNREIYINLQNDETIIWRNTKGAQRSRENFGGRI